MRRSWCRISPTITKGPNDDFTILGTTQEGVWIVFRDDSFRHVTVAVPCAFGGSEGVSFGRVFHFEEFDETISSTGDDFGVARVRHEFCRENISHVSCNQIFLETEC